MAKAWYADKNERSSRPFVLAGYAGTGKTTTLALTLEELGVEEGEYISVAFTGMAATVLKKKGHLASTIHQLIYDVIPLPNGKCKFKLKEEPPPYKILIIDELSQVSKEMFDDLQSFGIPILCMGDPYQTKQIGGTDHGLLEKPDMILTQVMRQSLDNPILWLATQIRSGKPIKTGNYGEDLQVVLKEHIPLEKYGQADQLVTTKNTTVSYLNNLVRTQVYGLDNQYPYVGEKLLMLKNDWSQIKTSKDGIKLSPVNGLLVLVQEIGAYDPITKTFDIKLTDPTTGITFDTMHADALYFENGWRDDTQLYEDPEYKKVLFSRKTLEDTKGFIVNKMTFGYATTTYKVQGSEFPTGIYIKDRYHSPHEDYTSVTRFSKSLIIGI